MKKFIIIGLVFVVGGLFLADYFKPERAEKREDVQNINKNSASDGGSDSTTNGDQEIETAAYNLNIPWDLAFLPDGGMLVTERPGILKKIGGEEFSIAIPEVEHVGEGGLLGIALHPDFRNNKDLYLYFTKRVNSRIINTVERFTLSGNSIKEGRTIITDIPGASNHNGGRIKFGPDGFLYITTGDAQNPDSAQDTNSLAGKILRLDENGNTPEGNPFGNAVYSYGHRNPQGLAWDDQGRLWATEHGRSGALSGLDELNLIEKGGNYGWPIIQGDEEQDGLISPAIHSGLSTWAPSGTAYHKNSIFFTGLRGEALYEAPINENGGINEIKINFENEFGRLRHVAVGTDGFFYLLTSNTDGRGSPKENDDKIIKVPIDIKNRNAKIDTLKILGLLQSEWVNI
jgi:glucose/arabinose dehydrogenase